MPVAVHKTNGDVDIYLDNGGTLCLPITDFNSIGFYFYWITITLNPGGWLQE